MSAGHWRGLRLFPVCSGYEWGWAESGAGQAEGVGREEGKIKADGTPWVRSGGQALVCTLFGTAPYPGRHSAAMRGNASICRFSDGTPGRKSRSRRDRRP